MFLGAVDRPLRRCRRMCEGAREVVYTFRKERECGEREEGDERWEEG